MFYIYYETPNGDVRIVQIESMIEKENYLVQLEMAGAQEIYWEYVTAMHFV